MVLNPSGGSHLFAEAPGVHSFHLWHQWLETHQAQNIFLNINTCTRLCCCYLCHHTLQRSIYRGWQTVARQQGAFSAAELTDGMLSSNTLQCTETKHVLYTHPGMPLARTPLDLHTCVLPWLIRACTRPLAKAWPKLVSASTYREQLQQALALCLPQA